MWGLRCFLKKLSLCVCKGLADFLFDRNRLDVVSLLSSSAEPAGVLDTQGQWRHGPAHLLHVPHRALPLHVLDVRPTLRHSPLQRALPHAALRQPGEHLHLGPSGLLVCPAVSEGLPAVPAQPYRPTGSGCLQRQLNTQSHSFPLEHKLSICIGTLGTSYCRTPGQPALLHKVLGISLHINASLQIWSGPPNLSEL